jgi:hypothetical protein
LYQPPPIRPRLWRLSTAGRGERTTRRPWLDAIGEPAQAAAQPVPDGDAPLTVSSGIRVKLDAGSGSCLVRELGGLLLHRYIDNVPVHSGLLPAFRAQRLRAIPPRETAWPTKD